MRAGFMPAEQGVGTGRHQRSASAWSSHHAAVAGRVDRRILVVHALETDEHPNALLEEVWRILTPRAGLRRAVARRGRVDGTFGFGRPYSRKLRELMRETLFADLLGRGALRVPFNAIFS